MAEARPLRTVVVGAPEVGAAGTMALLDVLSSVGRSWEVLHGRPPQPPVFAPRLLTLDGQALTLRNGLALTPHGRLDGTPAPDLVIVPELLVSPLAPLPAHYAPVADWLRGAHASGALVTSVCSGVLLLAEAGLLDGEEATSHWAFCDVIARRFPKVRLRKERILVPTGPGHRIVTAGGASSWYDLLLYLIARFAGSDRARQAAKVFLIEAHAEGQLPFAGLTARRQHEDRLVAEAQLWLADGYVTANPVREMVARSGLTERGFHARFKRATGLAPMDYVQVLRIEEAKHLLETTDLPVDEVAEAVGYQEPASFRRLFRRAVGVTASAYRRRNLLPAVVSAEPAADLEAKSRAPRTR
ncbi:GlxA family transcriptional regulator [Rubellimicrobium roseum]|uniref:Helix-turn-helix domain-containing protein n=1 Tax=Rubellimicrobium roseum TaxID=687525 RepID=A0A5C4NFU3_9RHOB|nr:helix-turn-helix domain-containing protein [Rubellimicrobium roseum]TNC71299.1 helix-turn-helix domain-containing protein [Rubellimicrobium roseum]